MDAELSTAQRCDECSADTGEASRPCAGCSVDVYVCTPCVDVVVRQLGKPYVCSFCRFVQHRAEDQLTGEGITIIKTPTAAQLELEGLPDGSVAEDLEEGGE